MGIDFNTFANQDQHTLELQKRYNEAKQEIRTGVSYIFMDTIQEYIDNGDLVDNHADGEEQDIFSNFDKKNLEAKFYEIHQKHGWDTNFTKMHAGDTFTYSKDEIFELAEAAGYVAKSAPKQEEKAEEEVPAVVQPEVKEEPKAAVVEAPVEKVENVDETGSTNRYINLLNSDPEIQELDVNNVQIQFKGSSIEDGETGENYDTKYKLKITSTDEQPQTASMSEYEKQLADAGFYNLSKEDQLLTLDDLEKEYQNTIDAWESDSSNKKHKKILFFNIGAKTNEYKDVLAAQEGIAQIQEVRNKINN